MESNRFFYLLAGSDARLKQQTRTEDHANRLNISASINPLLAPSTLSMRERSKSEVLAEYLAHVTHSLVFPAHTFPF